MTANCYYFAYGSNLNLNDWQGWCLRKGFSTELLKPIRKGWLVDHHPTYHYYSQGRESGALDVVEKPGHLTGGVLFEAQAHGWAALDAKEGAPNVYERRLVHVLDEEGGWHEAITYCVVPNRRRSRFIAPSEDYVQVVADGLHAHGLATCDHARAAINASPLPQVNQLFVYGTLQAGQSRAHALPGVAHREPAMISGTLFDLGPYPGWQPNGDDACTVSGELLTLNDPSITLPLADAIEGCDGYSERALYHRVLVKAVSADGRAVLAWCYRLQDSTAGKRIPSGRWGGYST